MRNERSFESIGRDNNKIISEQHAKHEVERLRLAELGIEPIDFEIFELLKRLEEINDTTIEEMFESDPDFERYTKEEKESEIKKYHIIKEVIKRDELERSKNSSG
jgi:isopropylmalate/homocitrate/citramalate synthase